uniref:Putative regulatory protein FmdB zinc ribbon domain-containing protein n=1 Tax=viral metagenome TaxID=1070528 RepID=A0A6M3IQT2_9ZZZZ
MNYLFRCSSHGEFEINQPIMAEHKANCPECHEPAQRIFTGLQHIWAGSVFRPDGSLRQDKDYAPVMRG